MGGEDEIRQTFRLLQCGTLFDFFSRPRRVQMRESYIVERGPKTLRDRHP